MKAGVGGYYLFIGVDFCDFNFYAPGFCWMNFILWGTVECNGVSGAH